MFPRLARANALLDELQAPPPEPVWTPPRHPSTIVAPLIGADGVYYRADSVGRATLVDEQPGTIPLLIRHRDELGVHGLVLRLERDTAGTLWAVCHVDDRAARLIRSGDYSELSPALLGQGHNSIGDDGRTYTDLLDARIVEVSLCEASASHTGRAHVTSTDVRSSRSGVGFDWPASHRHVFERAHDALHHQRTSTVLTIDQAPDEVALGAAIRRADIDRQQEPYRQQLRRAGVPVPSRRDVPLGGAPGEHHTRFYPNVLRVSG
jgi:hypothetical protein